MSLRSICQCWSSLKEDIHIVYHLLLFVGVKLEAVQRDACELGEEENLDELTTGKAETGQAETRRRAKLCRVSIVSNSS
jgi:hypothetical protein